MEVVVKTEAGVILSASSGSASSSVVLPTTISTTTSTVGSSSPSEASHPHNQSSSPKRVCLVCGDIASGFHYGVASCEACKAFFKRTIQGNIEYQCPASNDCEINKRRRKACQACRFQKCLRMGMLKEGVRLDRVRGGRQKYRRTLDGSSSGVHGSNSHGGSPHSGSHTSNGVMMNNVKRQPLDENKIILALINCEPDPLVLSPLSSFSSPSSSPSSSVANSPLSMTGLSHQSVLHSLSQSSTLTPSTTPVFSSSASSPPPTPNGSPTSSSGSRSISFLSELMDKELVSTISWAKQIPGFPDLILSDQMRLLQTTWGEILSLSLAYRSQLHSLSQNNVGRNTNLSNTSRHHNQNLSNQSNNIVPHKLVFSADFFMDESMAIEAKAEEMFIMLLQLSRRLSSLRLEKEEFLVLKALLLTNVDISLEEPTSVFKLRESLLHTLQDCVCSFHQPSSSATSHLGQILLCLPLIRQTDAAIRRYWINVRKDGKVPMNKLFIEMLESGVGIR